MNLNILYKDAALIAVEKPSGLLVHPYWKETNEKQNLMKQLKRQTAAWLYPVHRLDRPVSGIVIFGLVPEAVKEIQSRWHSEETKKVYKALVRGSHPEPMRFDFPLNNERKEPQEAITLARPLEIFEKATLMEVEIKTGRKHQIRRHFSRRCFQVIGDRMYGKKPTNDFYKERYGLERIFLHALKLEFPHPFENRQVKIKCPLPPDLAGPLSKMRLEA